MFFDPFIYTVGLFGDPLINSVKNENKQNHLGEVSSSLQSAPCNKQSVE